MKKPTYEELEKENENLILQKISRQKAAMHLVRQSCLELLNFCGINNLPAKVEIQLDYDRKDFYEYIPKSMLRGPMPNEN